MNLFMCWIVLMLVVGCVVCVGVIWLVGSSGCGVGGVLVIILVCVVLMFMSVLVWLSFWW